MSDICLPEEEPEAIYYNLYFIKYSGYFARVRHLPPGGKTEVIRCNLHFIKYSGFFAHVGHSPPGGGTRSHLL